MQVVILERNKLVARRAARHFASIGATCTLVEDPAALGPALPGATLLCSDAFDGDLVVELLRNRPGLRGLLWTAEPIKRSLRHMQDCPAISHVLARKDFESPPRPWELLMAARRILLGDGAPPFTAYLEPTTMGLTHLDRLQQSTNARAVSGWPHAGTNWPQLGRSIDRLGPFAG